MGHGFYCAFVLQSPFAIDAKKDFDCHYPDTWGCHEVEEPMSDETRHLLAYALLALLIVSGAVAILFQRKRLRERRRYRYRSKD